MINVYLISVLFLIAPLLGHSIRESGWGGKTLSTLLVVGESRGIFVGKQECTASLETLIEALLKIQNF